MSDYITASFDTLFDQATSTTASYLATAKREIDRLFGEGYAAKNPALVAAFIQTAAADMHTSTSGKVFGAVLQEIAQNIGSISQALENN